MEKKHKVLYLNRTIVIVMMMGYLALLILMLCMDWYLIGEYQRKNRQVEKEALSTYIKKAEEAMDNMNKLLYDIYSNNQNFTNLSQLQLFLEEYGDVYELNETMNQKILLDENIHGYYIFYQGKSMARYGVNRDIIKNRQPAALRNLLVQMLGEEGSSLSYMRRSTTVLVEGEVYQAAWCMRGNVAMYCIYSLGQIQNEIEENSGKKTEIIMLDNEVILKNEDLAEKLNLREEIQDSVNAFSGRIGKYDIYGQRIVNTDLWIFTIYSVNIWSMLNVQQLILLSLTLISVLSIILLYSFVKKQVVYPIRQLIYAMNEIRIGESKTVPSIEARFYEIQEINETLAAMIQELEQQKMKTYEEVIEKQKAQMQYLQLQLKPHFYLNGLKTLNALTVTGETTKMQELILDISKHVRYLLQSDRELVPLFQELEFVQNYVELQKRITGRLIQCDIKMDEQVREWRVPVLCAQTFVENSVKYAKLGSINMILKIYIAADILITENGKFLDLTILDNGNGYSEEILEEINTNPSVGKRGIGVNNIKRRCQILYGEKAEYHFTNCEGALSELILPEEEKNECIDGR